MTIWINISALTLIILAVSHFMTAGKANRGADGFTHLVLGAWFLVCGIMLLVKC